jgi:hypothetical protein
MSSASIIQKQISDAYAKASEATGEGALVVTLKVRGANIGEAGSPQYGAPSVYQLNALIGKFDATIDTAIVELNDIKLKISAITVDGKDIVNPRIVDEVLIGGKIVDEVLIGGKTYKISSVQPQKPAGIALSFELHLKG